MLGPLMLRGPGDRRALRVDTGSPDYSDYSSLNSIMVSFVQHASGQLIRPIACKPTPSPSARYVAANSHHMTSSAKMASPGIPSYPPSGASSTVDGETGAYCASLRSVHSSPGSLNSSVQSTPGSHHTPSPGQSYGPVMSPHSYGTMPHNAAPCSRHNRSHDDGYASQPDFHSHTNSTASGGSYSNHSNEAPPPAMAVTYVKDFQTHISRTGATHRRSSTESSRTEPPSMHASQVSVNTVCSGSQICAHTHTPSPSDSGMGDVEALIREKESELDQLRRTMERNEQAILQVCAEKNQNWVVKLQEVNGQWETRVRQHQQKSFRTEQGLLMQIFKLQQERKALRVEVDQLRNERKTSENESRSVVDECQVLRKKVEDLQWEVQQKTGELSLVKNKLREAQEHASNRDTNLVQMKAQLSESQKSQEVQREQIAQLVTKNEVGKQELDKTMEALTQTRRRLSDARATSTPKISAGNSPSSQDDKDSEILRLRAELADAKSQVESLANSYKDEKDQWLEEKNKVIMYQKHLQLNYMQMQRKNKLLEADIEQLTMELENRDFQLADTPQEAEESIC